MDGILVANPYHLQNMSAAEKTQLQHEANEKMRRHWKVEDGVLCFDGKRAYLVTRKRNMEILSCKWSGRSPREVTAGST